MVTGTDTAAPVEPGSWLGQYEVTSLIGQGAMGWVYRGRHGLLGRDVAIKVLSPALTEDVELVSRFFQEAKIVNAIRHPNIIDVTDFIHLTEPRRVAYVMELLPGLALSEVISDRRLRGPQVVNIAWQMLDALEAVHAGGVVHRDLKPDNVFVTGDLTTDLSTVPSIKLLDFGVAKVQARTAHRTATGTIVGTPAYMAPEQVAGETVAAPADVYAWAEMVYEMLTGERVFSGTPAAVLHRKLLPEPPALDVPAPDDAFAPLYVVLRRALSRRPGWRPTIAEAKAVLYRLGAATDSTARATAVVAGVADLDGLIEIAGPEEADGLESAVNDEIARAAEAHGGTRCEGVEPVALVFEHARRAVDFAEDLHVRVDALGAAAGIAVQIGVGVWTGNVYRPDGEAGGASGVVLESARVLMQLARGGQTLLGAPTADQARRTAASRTGPPLEWVSHGVFRVEGLPSPVELYEVGAEGRARFEAPARSGEALQVEDADTVAGWRPGSGLPVPGRTAWVLERRLGEGGFGEAWLAREDASGERRVFKFCFGERSQRALSREASLLERLHDVLGERSDVLRVLGSGLEAPPYFLETAYVAGGDLKAWIERSGGFDALSRATRLELIAQTAEALTAAHSVGVLHCDIKPGNILVDPKDDGGAQVVLADFGIGGVIERAARPDAGATLDAFAETVVPEATGSVTGTVLYMSPERLAGRPASLQADIYSLGVVLYQLLTGDLARPAASDWRADIDDPLLTEDLEDMLAGDPARRLADAGEVARRLRTLDERRTARAEEAKRRAAAERARRFRRVAVPVGVLLLLFGIGMSFQARRIAEEAERANRAAATASRVSEFLVDLFKVSNPSPVRANSVTARDLLDRGAERVRVGLSNEPLVRAEMMETISRVYVNLGLYGPALQLTREALDLREASLEPDDPKVAESFAALGMVHRLESRYDEAERAHRRAYEIRRAALGSDHPGTADSLTMLAQLAYLGGDAERARKGYEEALRIRERALGPDHAVVAESLTHLGWLLNEQGRFDEAKPILERALRIRDAALGHEHYLVAETLDLLAANASRRGRYEEAEELAREGLAIREKVLEPDHRRIGNSLLALGTIHRFRGRTEASAQVLGRAVKLLEDALGPEHIDVGLAWFELGLTYEQLGRWDEAAAAFRGCLATYEAIFGAEHPSVGQVLNNLGAILSERLSSYSEGEEVLRRAVMIFDADGNDDYWRALSRWSLANNLRDHGKYAEAEPVYRAAIGILEGKPGAERVDNPDLPALIADFEKLRAAAEKSERRGVR